MKNGLIILLCTLMCVSFVACKQDSSCLVKLGEYSGYEYIYNDPVVNEEEITEVIDRSYRISTAVKHEIKDRDVIEKDDFVVVNYTTYLNGRTYGTSNNESFKVGAGFYLPELENELIGKILGNTYSIDVTLPKDYPVTDIAGELVTFEVMATKIYYYEVPPMTDKYFQNMGYDSYEDYYNALVESKLYDLNYFERERVCNEIISYIIADSDFKLSAEEVEKRYDSIVKKHTQIADTYELSLLDYSLSVLKLESIEDFYVLCRTEAEYKIKDELIRSELVRVANIELTDDEIVDIAINRLNYPKDSIFDMKDQLRNIVTTQLLYDFLLENSIRVES